MARATHIAAMAGHTGDGIAGTITGIGTTDLDEALLMRLEVGETPKRGVWRQNAAGIVHQLDRKRTFLKRQPGFLNPDRRPLVGP